MKIKRIINIFIWLILIAYLIIVLGFVSGKKSKILCHSIEVTILDSINNKFIENIDILSSLSDKGYKLSGYPIENINTEKLEKLINKHPFIKNSEVYKTVDGILKIEVIQRDPIVRIINNKNESYYIDQEGAIMPLSDKYTSHVLVANGNIKESFNVKSAADILFLEANNKKARESIIYDLFCLAQYINSSEFWCSQIEQIYVNEKNEFELTPRVGAHIILFGDFEDYERKFQKLKTLYQKAFNKMGWNHYKTINLKYKDQIICTKR